jgi:hypothetical protein
MVCIILQRIVNIFYQTAPRDNRHTVLGGGEINLQQDGENGKHGHIPPEIFLECKGIPRLIIVLSCYVHGVADKQCRQEYGKAEEHNLAGEMNPRYSFDIMLPPQSKEAPGIP